MKISALHCKIINLGERGETKTIAIEPEPYETVEGFVSRVLCYSDCDPNEPTPHTEEHIELRLIKEDKK